MLASVPTKYGATLCENNAIIERENCLADIQSDGRLLVDTRFKQFLEDTLVW